MCVWCVNSSCDCIHVVAIIKAVIGETVPISAGAGLV